MTAETKNPAQAGNPGRGQSGVRASIVPPDTQQSKASPDRYQPQYRSISQLKADHPNGLKPPVIHGLLRQSEVGTLISTSKGGKTFFVLGLAMSVALGREFLGFKTERSKVLLLDAELDPALLIDRLQGIAAAMGIDIKDLDDWLAIEPLIEQSLSIHDLPDTYEQTECGEYGLIIIDPLYQFWPDDFSENDNGAMKQVFSRLRRWASKSGAAILCVHHAAKGNTSERSVIDMGAGAGASARACSTQIAIYEHADATDSDRLCVLEAVVRSYEAPSPIAIRFVYPLWLRSDAKPARKTRQNANQQKVAETAETLHRLLCQQPGNGWMSKPDVLRLTGLTNDRFSTAISRLIGSGKAEREDRQFELANGTLSNKKYSVYVRALVKDKGMLGQHVGLDVGPISNMSQPNVLPEVGTHEVGLCNRPAYVFPTAVGQDQDAVETDCPAPSPNEPRGEDLFGFDEPAPLPTEAYWQSEVTL